MSDAESKRLYPMSTVVAGIMVGAVVGALTVTAAFYWLSYENPDSPDFWIRRLRSGSLAERLQATHVLMAAADEGEPAVLSALMDALDDPNPKVRANAIVALHRTESAHSQIRELLNDVNPHVRSVAGAALNGCIVDARNSE